MNWPHVIAIAFGLAMDAMAVSIAVGLALRQLTGRHIFRISWHFGLFQLLMPALGWLAGRSAHGLIASWDHWLAFALLALLGGKMVMDASRGETDAGLARRDPTRGWMLVTLSVATSLDALAVGLSMALLESPIVGPCLVIGAVAAGLSCLGICFAARLRRGWGKRAEFAGGLVLIAIGVQTLLSHL